MEVDEVKRPGLLDSTVISQLISVGRPILQGIENSKLVLRNYCHCFRAIQSHKQLICIQFKSLEGETFWLYMSTKICANGWHICL